MSQTKFYARRDSATTVLRKLGIHARDYEAFITKVDGGVELNLTAAEAHAAQLKQLAEVPTKPAPTAKSAAKAAKPAPAKLAAKPTRRTVTSAATELLLAGKTNAEVWAAIQAEFQLDDSKKHYPNWYRNQLRRKGLLAK
jgi:hypothetical protein